MVECIRISNTTNCIDNMPNLAGFPEVIVNGLGIFVSAYIVFHFTFHRIKHEQERATKSDFSPLTVVCFYSGHFQEDGDTTPLWTRGDCRVMGGPS